MSFNVQSLPAGAPDIFVTLNPATPPAPEQVLRRLTLSHPLVSQASTRAQQCLPEVQVSEQLSGDLVCRVTAASPSSRLLGKPRSRLLHRRFPPLSLFLDVHLHFASIATALNHAHTWWTALMCHCPRTAS